MATIVIMFPASGVPIIVNNEQRARGDENIYWKIHSLNTAVEKVRIAFAKGTDYFDDGSGGLTNEVTVSLRRQAYDVDKYIGMGDACTHGIAPQHSGKDKYLVEGLTSARMTVPGASDDPKIIVEWP